MEFKQKTINICFFIHLRLSSYVRFAIVASKIKGQRLSKKKRTLAIYEILYLRGYKKISIFVK